MPKGSFNFIKNNQTGAAPLLLLLAVIGILGFIGLSSLGSFNSELFKNLFPKSPSFAAGTIAIFNATETASPGEVIALQGDGYGTNPEIWITLVAGGEASLTPGTQASVITKSNRFVAGRIPANLGYGLYAVWVKNGTTLSPPVFINKARSTSVEFDEVSSGHQMRIFGRNLILSGATPQVKFVDSGTNTTYQATITTSGSDQYVLKVNAPSGLTNGATYKVMVSNGYGGNYGESESEDTVKARSGGADAWGLAVPWSADFNFSGNVYNVKTDSRLTLKAVGNGTTDDRAAIQAAIDRANTDGGGVVYLPTATYLINPSGNGLNMKSKVVLKGDGKNLTILNVGTMTTGDYGTSAIKFGDGTTTSGVVDLMVKNLGNVDARHPATFECMASCNKIFAHQAKFDISTSMGNYFIGSKNILISESDFDIRRGRGYYGSWYNFGSTYVTYKNNTLKYYSGRLPNVFGHHYVFDSNHVTRDGDHQPGQNGNPGYNDGLEGGGLEEGFVFDVQIINNTFDTVGAYLDPYPNNDGESMTDQPCTAGYFGALERIGGVTGATDNTFSDSGGNWPQFTKQTTQGPRQTAFDDYHDYYAITIIDGPGTGQVRKLISNTSTTATIDKPWDVLPTSASKYLIDQWTMSQFLFDNNTFTGQGRGLWLYCNSYDGVFAGNQLTDSNGIWIRPRLQLNVVGGDPVSNGIVINWKILAADNIIKNTIGRKAAFIGVMDKSAADMPYGVGALGIEVRRNTVDAYTPNTLWESWAPVREGMWIYSETATAGVTSILGMLFEDNKMTDTNSGYQTSSAANQTVVADSVNTNVTNVVTGSGVGTVIDNAPTVPLPTSGPTASPTPAPVQAPYPPGSLAEAIPGTIEAEDYDGGGEGVAYHDTETTQKCVQYGSTFRTTEGVDVCNNRVAGQPVSVDWTESGEWLEYTVNVTQTGTYDLSASVASGQTGGAFHVEFSGVDKTGVIAVPNTTSSNIFQDVTKSNIALTSGTHIMRVAIEPSAALFNLNSLSLTLVPTTTPLPYILPAAPTVQVISSCISPNFTGNAVTISWTNPTGGNVVTWVDVSDTPTFNTYFNKNVIGTFAATAPAGFATNDDLKTPLALNPATTYYVWLYNGAPAPNYEHSPITSFSIPACSASTPTPTPKIGDLNSDISVNLLDFNFLLSKWGTVDAVADINQDGRVNLLDFTILISNWGR